MNDDDVFLVEFTVEFPHIPTLLTHLLSGVNE